MKCLIVGLGSMGKRRVRNLQSLGYGDITGVDLRPDRRDEARRLYGIKILADFAEALTQRPDAVIVSLPPDLHIQYALSAVESGSSVFTEASVTDDGIGELMARLRETGLIGYPSRTMRYFSGPMRIKEIVRSGEIGKCLFWTYHCGQYLPDWHPWEKVTDFYVSKRSTGGCREIVPFELVWLTDIFGYPRAVRAEAGKVSTLPIDIDDVYFINLNHADGTYGQLVVDVVARSPLRALRVVGSEGTLEWSSKERTVRVYRPGAEQPTVEVLDGGTIEKGYINPESPYIQEMADFVACVQNRTPPAYGYAEDVKVLRILYASEESSRRGQRIELTIE